MKKFRVMEISQTDFTAEKKPELLEATSEAAREYIDKHLR